MSGRAEGARISHDYPFVLLFFRHPLMQDRLEQGSKHSQDPPSNPDEQEVTLVCEDPQDSLSPFSEKSTPAP